MTKDGNNEPFFISKIKYILRKIHISVGMDKKRTVYIMYLTKGDLDSDR